MDWATPLSHLGLGSWAFRAPRPLLSSDATTAAVKSRDITLHRRSHATQKGEGVPGLCATLAPQTPSVWRARQRACSARTARAQCAQILSNLSEGPAQGLSRKREDSGLWEGGGVGFASQEVRGHRASHPLGGFDLGRSKYPSRRGLSLPNSAWRCSATSEPRVPFPRPPHPAGSRTAGGRHALTCTADPPRGPEPGFEVRRIPTRLGEVDARPHTAARPLPP